MKIKTANRARNQTHTKKKRIRKSRGGNKSNRAVIIKFVSLSIARPTNLTLLRESMESFKSVCASKLNVSESAMKEWCEQIESAYRERPYHNLDMLSGKMAVIEEEFPRDESLYCALILATTFQYYHFDVKSDQTENNCKVFERFVETAVIDNAELVGRTLQLLKVDSSADDEAICIFRDLDLVVLGSLPEKYKTYAKGVQAEFTVANEETYKRDRLKMLKTLLTIPFIYSNQRLRDRFESTARSNIQTEIESLEA